GGFLRFFQLAAQSPFIDEAFTVAAAQLPVTALLPFLAAHDAHPPLFYLAAHAAVTALPWPPTWFRFLTAPFGLLTILATWGLAHHCVGRARRAGARAVVVGDQAAVAASGLRRRSSDDVGLGPRAHHARLRAARRLVPVDAIRRRTQRRSARDFPGRHLARPR